MIHNIARQEQNEEVFQEIGIVTKADKNHFSISVDDASYSAKKATSCLHAPEPGDKVLLLLGKEECYILAILEKKESSSKLVFDGDTEFISKNGRIRMASQQGLEFLTTGTLNFTTPSLQLAAEEGTVNINKLTVLGSYLLSKLAQIKIIGGSLDALYERYRQKTKRSYREVTETDYVKAEQLDYTADSLMSLHGKYSFINAEEDVKINGERIHMG